MPKIVPPPDPTAKEEPGAQIARWLGPVGGGFVLLLSVLMVVFCLTRGADPVPGYTPPHDSDYYAQHLDELAQELNANVLPVLDETAHAEARVLVHGADDGIRIEHWVCYPDLGSSRCNLDKSVFHVDSSFSLF